MAKLSFESFFFVGGPTFYPRSGLLLGYPRILRGSLKFEKHSSKMFCEEFVLRRLVASPLIKLRFTPGGRQEVKCVPLEGFRRLVVGLDAKDRLNEQNDE